MSQIIIPYIPLAPRVKANNAKSEMLCRQFFKLIDQITKAQMLFNHDTSHGKLSICPEQINDLFLEMREQGYANQNVDVHCLRQALNDLIYPEFKGEFTVESPIWNGQKVTIWQFQLNEIVREVNMKNNDSTLQLDQVLAAIRIWRASLETATSNPQVTYNNNDLVYKLLDLEQKLEQVQHQME